MGRRTVDWAGRMAALSLLLMWLNSCHAQGFANGELERSLRPGVLFPYDGAGYSHRYNYDIGSVFYLNYDASRFAYLEYLDRLERQEQFGHRWPSSRFGQHAPSPPTASKAKGNAASRPMGISAN